MNNLKNSVRLTGRLGNDPEFRTFESGKQNATFSMATSDTYINKEGFKVTDTEWHNIVVWGNLADLVSKFLKKGIEVSIEGKLTRRSFEHEGETKYVTEVVMREFLLHGGKPETEETTAE